MKGICILNRLISRDPNRDWKRALWAFLAMQCLCILLEQVQYRNVFLKTNNSLFGIRLHKSSCSLIFLDLFLEFFCEIVWISSASEIQKCFFKPILISLGSACTKMQFFLINSMGAGMEEKEDNINSINSWAPIVIAAAMFGCFSVSMVAPPGSPEGGRARHNNDNGTWSRFITITSQNGTMAWTLDGIAITIITTHEGS